MKRIALMFLLALGVTAGSAQSFQAPAAGKAVVYFVRISGLGSMVDFYYYDSAKFIGKFAGRKYIRYECEPGKHLFWARAENRDFVEADLEAGRIYLLEAIPQMGMMKAAVTLYTIDMTNKKNLEKVNKLLEKPPVTFTDEEMAERAAKLTEQVQKALEKYKSEKASGKKMHQLEKTNFFEPPK